jgi:hypothetical protein
MQDWFGWLRDSVPIEGTDESCGNIWIKKVDPLKKDLTEKLSVALVNESDVSSHQKQCAYDAVYYNDWWNC